MADLPKNISLVQYKNKDGSKQLKYQVRVSIKKIPYSKLFDDLTQAKAWLIEVKSTAGRIALTQEEIDEKRALDEFRSPKLDWYLDVYFRQQYPTPPTEASELKRKQHNTYKSFFETIKNTQIVEPNAELLYQDPQTSELMRRSGFAANYEKKRRLGSMKLHEITYRTINDYIRTRAALGMSENTVRKEVSIISCFYEQARHNTEISLKLTQDLDNPTKKIDRKLYDNKTLFPPRRKREKGLGSDANYLRILDCIYCEDIEFGYTLLLQLFSAMRMSEAVYLKWEDIDIEAKTIFLEETKTGSRRVFITKDMLDLLDTIEPDISKRTGLVVKNQSYYKYQKQIQRFREKYKFNLRTHQLRKQAITNMINRVGEKNSIKLAEILGFVSVTNFNNNHIQQNKTPNLDTIEGVLNHSGHTDESINITKNSYYDLRIDDA